MFRVALPACYDAMADTQKPTDESVKRAATRFATDYAVRRSPWLPRRFRVLVSKA
jgi:hypothetical protein